MVKSKNNEMYNGEAAWNACRLVKEYVRIAWMLNDSVPFENLPWDCQVRIRRVASVVRAYLNALSTDMEPFAIIDSVFSNLDNREVLKNSEFGKSEMTQLKGMLCQAFGDDWKMEHMLKHFDVVSDREQLLRTLLRFRVVADELENTFSGVMEVRTGTSVGIKALRNLYSPKLHECNEKVDDMIVLLLGKTFQKTLSERELVEKYDYPTATDEELLDWRLNNN